MPALPPELARIFLDEARGHLATARDTKASPIARSQALVALAEAAAAIGDGDIEAAARTAARDPGAMPALVEQVEALAPLGQARPVGGAGPAFDEDEAALLASIFLEEAGEHLDELAETLRALESQPGRRDLLDLALRKTHTIKGSAATVGRRAVADGAHRLEDAIDLRRRGQAGAAPVRDLQAALDLLRRLVAATPAQESAALADLVAHLDRGARAEAPAARSLEIEASDVLAELSVAEADRRFRPDRRGDPGLLRVEARAVDGLLDAVGDLVFDRARIDRRTQELGKVARDLGKTRAAMRLLLGPLRGAAQAASSGQAPSPEAVAQLLERIGALEGDLAAQTAQMARTAAALADDAEALGRSTGTLHAGLTQVRMTAVRGLFNRLAQPVRELAWRAGKEVEVEIGGEETRLDKTVVDQVVAPLEQLVRNAVAHGVEGPKQRSAAGKPAAGKITMSARTQGDSVYLEVADDGAGIDVSRLRAQLLASGRLSPGEAGTASDDRVLAAIFAPGVSTKDDADEQAGRGVGLDVVRDAIARLGGEIVVASQLGKGTRFTMRLPVTTALTHALLFKVGGNVYALPVANVGETTQLEVAGGALPSHVSVRDDLLPLVSLHELLRAELPRETRKLPVVALTFAGRRFAVTTDKLVGPRELVVKSLGPLLAPLGLYAGATVSAAAKVQLILDVAALAQIAFPPLPGVDTALADELLNLAPQSQKGFAAVRLGQSGARGPARPSTAPPVRGRPSQPGLLAAPPAAATRILVVDDSRSVREAVGRLLTGAGYAVDTAGDGLEAFELCADVAYDLVITDLEMPRLDGYGLIARLRGSAATAKTPILVISSRTDEDHRTKAQAAGATSYLAKPVTKDSLLQALAGLLP